MDDVPTPLRPDGGLRIKSAGRVVAAGARFTFDVEAAAGPAAGAGPLRLSFPGFRPAGFPEALPSGGWRLAGCLPEPGFHALAAEAGGGGRVLAGRDYFVARGGGPARPGPGAGDCAEAGYYVFLGCGDYPIITGRETHPLAGWTADRWGELVAWMGANGMNRLWVLLNGYTLAYPSKKYPGLRDRNSRNASEDFLGGLIRRAHANGVRVHLALTSDGHARDFSRARPAAVRLDAEGRPDPHFGLALEHPLTRGYIFDVLDEVLGLYPEADGVAVHPTESDPERFNPESLAAFREETGRDLRAEPFAERRAWHNRAFARFMGEIAERCRRHNPAMDVVMLNCPWQDGHAEVNCELLPAEVRVAVWHYAWEDTRPQPWPIYRWVEAFGPGRIIYLPTSQSYLYPDDPGRVMDRHIGTDRLVSTAAVLGVRNTMYFAGWDILDEEARLCDAMLVQRPTAALAGHPTRSLIPRLYADYFGLREELMKRRGSVVAGVPDPGIRSSKTPGSGTPATKNPAGLG